MPEQTLISISRSFTCNSTTAASVRKYELTEREAEIVDLLVAGYSNQEISIALSISAETVKRHLSNIFEKTGRG
jgi:DNA-binding CsgD family transcriptional regulator